MKKIQLFGFLVMLISVGAKAQFSGNYAIANWTTTKTTGAGINNNASVNTSSAPSSITITGSDDPANPFTTTAVNIDYTITAAQSGQWRFNWTYVTNDMDNDPQWDRVGVLINNVFTQLSANTLNARTQSGTFSQNVTAGATIGFRVSAVDNSFGNATFTISSFLQPTVTLPTVLSSFTAAAAQKSVLLQWVEATAFSNDHYEIERSAGTSFEKIGQIAVSNSGSYQFTDASPKPGINYYRLRMVDKNGSFVYSDIRAVKFNEIAAVHIFPIPAVNFVTVELTSPAAANETIQLFDATGKLVASKLMELSPGNNTATLDIHQLSNGVYLLRAGTGGWTQRILKN